MRGIFRPYKGDVESLQRGRLAGLYVNRGKAPIARELRKFVFYKTCVNKLLYRLIFLDTELRIM